jgi:hypothetical protein
MKNFSTQSTIEEKTLDSQRDGMSMLRLMRGEVRVKDVEIS